MIERTLNYLGLTEYERKLYLFLVRHGTTGAVELSKKTGVPFGRIYDVLYQLEAKCFIKVVLTQPKAFSPIQPRVALSSALKKLKEEYSDIETQGLKTIEELQKDYLSEEELKRPSISMVSGEQNIQEVRRRELLSAKSSINAIISPDKSTGAAPVLERLAREAGERGVKRRFLENPTTKTEKEKVKMKLEGGAEIRIADYQGFTLSIVDEREVRIEVTDPQHGRSSVLIESPELAKAMNEFFEHKWRESKPAQKRLLS
jgi:sugar-specific transcriptional regulator TrmB